MSTAQPRRFWEYREYDGTTTNRRITFTLVCMLAAAILGFVVALIGGLSTWWPIIPVAAAIGALGATIAHTIDYISDRKEGAK